MLYSIIPPIILVLSIVGLIIFLTKRSHRFSQIETTSDFLSEIENENGQGVGAGKTFLGSLKNFFISLLEKITRKTRLMFLKLENSFKKFSDYLRSKKKTEVTFSEETKEESEEISEPKEADPVIEKVINYDLKKTKKEKKFGFLKNKEEKKEEEEEKVFRPIISDKVVSPRNKTEIKDRLEDLLIERIAINPKDIEAYERLGEYYMEIGNHTHAKECFKQVLKLDPGNRSIKYRMRRLERVIGG